MVAKRLANCQGLDLVVDGGACAMGVDVIDLVDVFDSVFSRVGERHLDATGATAALGVRIRNAKRIGRGAVTQDLANHLRAACFGVFIFLKHNNRSPFAKYEAIAIEVERTRRPFGLVVSFAQGGEQIKTGHAERMNHAVSAAREHDVGFATSDNFGRFADRLTTGGAGR